MTLFRLALFIIVSLALTACAGDPALVESTSAPATTARGVADIPTSTPTSIPPSPTMPKPTATFVPLVTPSPTVEGLTKVDVPRIGVVEARAMAESGMAVLVDVRTEAIYEGQHIAGAISMPADQVAQRHGELPSDKLVIFYCA